MVERRWSVSLSLSLSGSSMKGTWREGSLAEDAEGYLERALETGKSLFMGVLFGESGGGLVCRGL
jgi:hypothetical protein